MCPPFFIPLVHPESAEDFAGNIIKLNVFFGRCFTSAAS